MGKPGRGSRSTRVMRCTRPIGEESRWKRHRARRRTVAAQPGRPLGRAGAGRPPGGPAERFAGRLRGRHPAAVFFAALLAGFALLGCDLDRARAARDRRAARRRRRGADRRERRHVARRRAHAVPHRRLGGRLDGRRRAAAADPGGSDRAGLRVPAQVADRRLRGLRARRRVGDLPRHVAGGAARAAPTSSGSRTCPPTPASRPVTRRRRSPSTPAWCCCSRRGSTRARLRIVAWAVAIADPRASWPWPGCTAACTTRSTSREASSSASARCSCCCSPAARRASRTRRGRPQATTVATSRRRAAGRMRVAVVAHAEKTLGGGLPELRRVLEAAGVEEPLWYEVPKAKRASEQVRARAGRGGRARVRLGRRRNRAALHRRARRLEGQPRGASRRHGQPVRDQPRDPQGHRAGRRHRASRRSPQARRRALRQGALRGHGRRRLRRGDDPRRRRPQGADRPGRVSLERVAQPAQRRASAPRSRSTAPTGTRAARRASCSATSATSSAASRCSPTPAPTTACSSSAS